MVCLFTVSRGFSAGQTVESFTTEGTEEIKDSGFICETLRPLCLIFIVRTAPLHARRTLRAFLPAETVAAPRRCPRLPTPVRPPERLPRLRGPSCPRTRALRYRLARRLIPRFWSPALAFGPRPSRSRAKDFAAALALLQRLPPVHFAALTPGPHPRHRRHSRAKPALSLPKGVSAPHDPYDPCLLMAARNRYLPPPFPRVRRDDLACLLRGLSPSCWTAPAATDVAERAADRAACGDIRAPAAPRGETPARKPGRPDANPLLNPESLRPQSADCLPERIPRMTRYILSSNTRLSPDPPSARFRSFLPLNNLPESPCALCPQARPSASSPASGQRYNSKSHGAMLPDERPRFAAFHAAQPDPQQYGAQPTPHRWQMLKSVPPAESAKFRFPGPWKSRRLKPWTSGSPASSSPGSRPAARFPSAVRIRRHECICRIDLRLAARQF